MFLASNKEIKRSVVPMAQGGFSMIELMITISIMAVLLAMAAPSFTAFLNGNRVGSQANELLATFQIARNEAIRSGSRVVVCGSNDASNVTPTCSGSTSWGGWVAFIDTDRDGAYDATERLLQANVLSGVTATASSNVSGAVVFRSDGLARSAGGALLQGKVGLCVSTVTPPQNARDVTFALGGGRLSIAKRNAGISCAAPAN